MILDKVILDEYDIGRKKLGTKWDEYLIGRDGFGRFVF